MNDKIENYKKMRNALSLRDSEDNLEEDEESDTEEYDDEDYEEDVED